MEWYATCFNWNCGDTFTAFGTTEDEAVNKIVDAYKKWYSMTDEDVKEEYAYDSFLDYLVMEKELVAYKIIPNGIYINGDVRYKTNVEEA